MNGTTMTTSNGNGSAPLLPEAIERVLIQGDLSQLGPKERVAYYNKVCESLGLNPLTQPFDYVKFQGKEKLYAKRDATDQLRAIYRVSIRIASREVNDGVLNVIAVATLPDGRSDEALGSLSVQGLRGDALALAQMKAETKAKRRATLSICGLGWLDETEVEDVKATPAVPQTLADLKAHANATPKAMAASIAAPMTAAEFSEAANAIADTTPPPSGFVKVSECAACEPDALCEAHAEQVAGSPLLSRAGVKPPEPDPVAQGVVLAESLIAGLESVKHRKHCENWERKHRADVAWLKANAPAEYQRVIEAWTAAKERTAT